MLHLKEIDFVGTLRVSKKGKYPSFLTFNVII